MSELDLATAPIAIEDGGALLPGRMDCCMRKIGQTTSMVRVTVGQNDVIYIRRTVAQPLDLPYRRVCFLKLETGHLDEFRSDPPIRVLHV